MSITIYGREGCEYCKKSQSLLDKKSYIYEYLDVTKDKEALSFVKGIGMKTVPVIVIDGEIIGGYSELLDHFDDMRKYD